MNPQLLQHLELYDLHQNNDDELDDGNQLIEEKLVDPDDDAVSKYHKECETLNEQELPFGWRGGMDSETLLHLVVLIAAFCSVYASSLNSSLLGSIQIVSIAFVLGNRAPVLIPAPGKWLSREDNTRCQINTLLGSVGAPPLEEKKHTISLSQKKGFHIAVLSMVKSYVGWIEAVEYTLQILRTATALDLGRTTTVASCGPIVDRLELSISGYRRRCCTRRIPLYRLRREMWRLLERQRTSLEALVVEDDNDNERYHSEWTNGEIMEPQNITLAELRLACVKTGQLLSKVTNHLLLTKAIPGELMVYIQEVTRQTSEARAYLGCWIKQAKDGDNQSSNVLNDLNSIEEDLATLQVALQSLRELHQQKPLLARGGHREQWDSFRRVFASLHEQVKYMEQIYLSDEESSEESDQGNQQKESRSSVSAHRPEQVEYCSASEREAVAATDCPHVRDDRVGRSATLVFAGQGTRVLHHARFVSKQRRRRNNSTSYNQPSPDSSVSEQHMLDELRRHLKAMPLSREVEINVDEDIETTTPNTQEMKCLNVANETHNESIPFPHINHNAVLNDLAEVIQLVCPPTDECTLE